MVYSSSELKGKLGVELSGLKGNMRHGDTVIGHK